MSGNLLRTELSTQSMASNWSFNETVLIRLLSSCLRGKEIRNDEVAPTLQRSPSELFLTFHPELDLGDFTGPLPSHRLIFSGSLEECDGRMIWVNAAVSPSGLKLNS